MCIHDCGNNEWLSGKRTTRETSRDPPGGRAPRSRSAEGGAEVSAGEPPTMAASARAMSQPLAASARRRVLAECAAWWAVRGLQWMANMLPERLLGTAARALGDFVYVVVRWRRRLAEERVALALPHLSHAEHRLVVRDSYTHLALALLWFLRLPRIQQYGHGTIQRLVEISEETKGYLQQILEETGRSQSAIITSGHIGFWELLPTLLASSILPTHTQSIVYRPLHNDPINRLVKELRSGERRELIEDKNCFSLLHHKLKNASEPSLVGLVADQRQTNPRGQCIVQFLGQSTALSTGAARLRVSTGASLWFAAVIGNSQKKRANSSGKPFKLILRPISTNATQDQRDGVQQLMQTYASALEDVVQMCATQYLWIHDLWKHR